MATIKSLVSEVLFERAQLHLKIFYNIDVQLFPGEDQQVGVSAEQQAANQTLSAAAGTEAAVAPSATGAPPAPAPAESVPQGTTATPPPVNQSQTAFSKKVNGIKEDVEEPKEPKESKEPKEPTEPEKVRALGYIALETDEAYNIQTAEDLIEFLSTKIDGGKTNKEKDKTKKIFNDFIKESLVLITTGAPMNQLIGKKDKFIVELDYGFEKDNSIGMKVNKLGGVASMSISMKKDDDLIPGPFNVNAFNERLLYFRNELNSPSMGKEEQS
jgi:hypothetical protein